MFTQPAIGSPLRDAFSIGDLVDMKTGAKPWTTLQSARAAARRSFGLSNPKGMIHRVFSIVLRGDDEVQLVSIGSRGGYKVEWSFGWA